MTSQNSFTLPVQDYIIKNKYSTNIFSMFCKLIVSFNKEFQLIAAKAK